jgi:hypothetical protein
MKKFRVVLRYGEHGEEKVWFFIEGENEEHAKQRALMNLSLELSEEPKEEPKKAPTPTTKKSNIPCVDCFQGKLILVIGCNDASCEHCGTDFIMTGETSFVYATPQNIAKHRKVEQKSKPKAEKIRMVKPKASISSSGEEVSVQAFVSRKKIPYSEPISRLPITKWEDVEDIDNGEKYNWIMVGLDKYDRTMYCTKTKIRRSTTMGEFYGTSPVD